MQERLHQKVEIVKRRIKSKHNRHSSSIEISFNPSKKSGEIDIEAYAAELRAMPVLGKRVNRKRKD